MATVPDFSNLKRATDDVLLAANDTDAGPADERDFAKLRTRLTTARLKLPPLYRDAVYDPFVAELDRLGDAGYKEVLASDPNNESSGRLMLDIAQAILQQAENFSQSATDAYQEVISDLYDGFLSAEDRRGVKKPDRSVVPPLVKWGEPASGPYTWPAEATESFNLKTGIVSMPPAHARHGLLAWAALGQLPSAVFAAARAKPNIVYILCDDLGYGDVRCLNPDGKIPTPNMDRLAREGMVIEL